MPKKINWPKPEIREPTMQYNYHGESIMKINFKPFYLTYDHEGNPEALHCSLKEAKKYLDERRNHEPE